MMRSAGNNICGIVFQMSVFSPRDFAPATRPNNTENLRVRSRWQNLFTNVDPRSLREYLRPSLGWLGNPAKLFRRAVTMPVVKEGHGGASPLGGSVKRVFDVVIASVALVLLSPVLVVLAIAVAMTTRGSVIYRHRRVGFGGKTFDCLKFRTMVADSEAALQAHLLRNPAAAEEWQRTRKLTIDPRITRLGFLLRKTSLDELPQLLNIIAGDMSCVGPRPVVSDELQLYGERVREYFSARPGITGLWQISGRSLMSYDERTLLDAKYVREWSWTGDLSILVRTLPAILKTDRAA